VEPTLLASILKFGELGLLGLFGIGAYRLLLPIAKAAAAGIGSVAAAAVSWFENQIQTTHHLLETSIGGFARLTVLMEGLHREVTEYTKLLQKENNK